MANRCGDCDYLNRRETKWNGEKIWCDYKGYYVKPGEVACDNYTYHGHRYGRYLVTATCNILNIDNEQRKNLFKSFDLVRFEKTPEAEYMYDALNEYDIVGPIIADKLYKDNFREVIADSMYYEYILPCYELIKDGKYLEAVDKYVEMTYTLIDFYLSDKNKNVRVK